MRRALVGTFLIGSLSLGCGPKTNVEILKTTVVPAPPTTAVENGPERFLPNDVPPPFKLGGGPVAYRGDELAQYLKDKRTIAVVTANGDDDDDGEPQYQVKDPSGWSEKVQVMVTAEYIDPIERPIAVEVYELADPMLARLFAEAYFPDQADRSHKIADRYLVHVLWFAPDDPDLRDAGLELEDAIARAILAETKEPPTPTPTPTESPAETPEPVASPVPSPAPSPTPVATPIPD